MDDHSIGRRSVLALLMGYPFAIAAGRFVQGEANPEDLRRRVIISSDDAGMCQSVNEGTIKGMTQGIVRSASIMTCCPAFAEFAEFAVANPRFDYGVHLTLTCDLPEQPWGPVTGSEAKSLTNDEGLFHWWPPDNVKIEEVANELRAQIDKALAAGIRITHLDNHMFSLGRSPELLKLYVRLGTEYSLPIRNTRIAPAQISQQGEEMLAVFDEQVRVLSETRFPLLDHVEAANYSVEPELKRGYFLDAIRRLPTGLSEVITHCAVTGHPISPSEVEKRQADTDFFTSEEAVQLCKDSRIEIVSWDQT